MCTASSTSKSSSAPYQCCLLLNSFEYIRRRTCPGMSSAGPILPSKLALHMWESGPPFNNGFLCHLSPHPKWHLDRFSRFCTGHGKQQSLHITMGRTFSPHNCPSHGGTGPLSNTWYLGLTQVHIPNGISIGSAVFAGLMIIIHQQTVQQRDHTTPSVITGRIYHSTAMRPNNSICL